MAALVPGITKVQVQPVNLSRTEQCFNRQRIKHQKSHIIQSLLPNLSRRIIQHILGRFNTNENRAGLLFGHTADKPAAPGADFHVQLATPQPPRVSFADALLLLLFQTVLS